MLYIQVLSHKLAIGLDYDLLKSLFYRDISILLLQSYRIVIVPKHILRLCINN